MKLTKDAAAYALITGASKGIGREIAFRLAKKGNNLILVARNLDDLEKISAKLEKTYNVKIFNISADLCKDTAAEEIYKQCIENNLAVNMLINNAGAATFGRFDKIDIKKQLNTIKLNVNSLIELTYYFIPELKKHSNSFILNVSSIVSLYPVPYFSVYAASKAFVLSFTKALMYELKKTTIKVSCLCPGDTDTGFFNTAGLNGVKASFMKPETVAKIAVKKLLKNKAVIFPKNVKIIAKIPKPLLKRIVASRVSKYVD
ncbi:MAG: SDR family oxidoreductase [Firmicutes bacterium]|nr:SDR family oxidoreductase [Bacillota bacterium]